MNLELTQNKVKRLCNVFTLFNGLYFPKVKPGFYNSRDKITESKPNGKKFILVSLVRKC